MVGKRTWAGANGATQQKDNARQRMPGRKVTDHPGTRNERPRLFQFADSEDVALEERRREELKDRLLNAVDRENLEKYRKSDKQVRV
jgi:hypothetical protein